MPNVPQAVPSMVLVGVDVSAALRRLCAGSDGDVAKSRVNV